MHKEQRAAIEFSLRWTSSHAQHTDRIFTGKIDYWRDFFPGSMQTHLSSLSPGEQYIEQFAEGILVSPYDKKKVYTFNESLFEGMQSAGKVKPRAGRFYPRGMAWRALNSFSENTLPFRIIAVAGRTLIADTNHPLSTVPLIVEATCIELMAPVTQRGGSCNDISEMITQNGPGMQAPHPGVETDFYSEYPFRRANSDDDKHFYHSARMVHHLDEAARQRVQGVYSRLIPPGQKILDLMSSWESHLPHNDYTVTGLGLNEEELQANTKLSDYVVHDLNSVPELPFKEKQFDTVICTASIEYLVQPLKVCEEISRVTQEGGKFIVIVSDRWFRGKEILPWADLHPFERQGLILDYFMKTGKFEQLHTESIRGFPRPINDKCFAETSVSDPLYIVWGTRRDK